MLVQRGKEGRGEAGEGRGEWSLGRCGEEGRGDGTREEREERSPRLAGPVRRRGEGEGRRGRIEGRGNRADAERRGGARGVVAGLVQRGGKGLGDSGKKGEEGPPPLPLLTLQWWKLPMTLPAAATAATAAAPPRLPPCLLPRLLPRLPPRVYRLPCCRRACHCGCCAFCRACRRACRHACRCDRCTCRSDCSAGRNKVQ